MSENGEAEHTNNIESLWRAMNDFLRTHHYSKREYMNSYVREWAARFNNHTPGIPKIFSMFGICNSKNVILYEKQIQEEPVVNYVEEADEVFSEEEEESIAKRLLDRIVPIRKFFKKISKKLYIFKFK